MLDEAGVVSKTKCATRIDLDASDSEEYQPPKNKALRASRVTEPANSNGSNGTKRSHRAPTRGSASKRSKAPTILEQIDKAAENATKKRNYLYHLDDKGEEIKKIIPNLVTIQEQSPFAEGAEVKDLHIWVVEGEGVARIAKCSICQGTDYPREIKLMVRQSLHLCHTRFTR